jgi:hypothetical protein
VLQDHGQLGHRAVMRPRVLQAVDEIEPERKLFGLERDGPQEVGNPLLGSIPMDQRQTEQARDLRVIGIDGERGPIPGLRLLQLNQLVKMQAALQGVVERIRRH